MRKRTEDKQAKCAIVEISRRGWGRSPVVTRLRLSVGDPAQTSAPREALSSPNATESRYLAVFYGLSRNNFDVSCSDGANLHPRIAHLSLQQPRRSSDDSGVSLGDVTFGC
jgi:hypothetical protein